MLSVSKTLQKGGTELGWKYLGEGVVGGDVNLMNISKLQRAYSERFSYLIKAVLGIFI